MLCKNVPVKEFVIFCFFGPPGDGEKRKRAENGSLINAGVSSI